MIAEIISASTEQLDRQAKYDLYREQGVSYYLIADPSKRELDIYQLDAAGVYQKLSHDSDIFFDVCGDCRLTISAAKLFD